MSQIISTRRLNHFKKNVPFLLQELLTKNLITPNKSKTYTFINRDYGELSKYLYNKTGLQLIKMNDSYKLQTKSNKPIQITKNDTPLTYQLYILITASLIARRLNEEFTQQELADEILPNFEDIEMADSTFKSIIRYMINEKYLSIKTETDENDDEIKILKKLAQPVIYTGELKSHKLSNITKITNYLLTHPTMNKLEHPSLFENVELDDLIEHFEQFKDENSGYKLVIDGNIIRAVSVSSKYAFPNLNNINHRVLVDILPKLRTIKNENLDEELLTLIPTSKHYKDSVSFNEVKNLIEEYDLQNIRTKINR